MTVNETDSDGGEQLPVPEHEDGSALESEGHPVEAALRRVGLGFLTGPKGIVFAVFVFLLGSISGVYLDELVRSLDTGFFGPSLEELLEKQKIDEHFSAIQQKLDRLSNTTSPEEIDQLRAELRELIERQREYVAYLQRQAASYYADNARTKDELLKGVAPQADFSLQTNRAVTLGRRGNIFSTLRIYDEDTGRVRINLNGREAVLDPGDQLNLSTDEEECVIGYVGLSRSTNTTQFNMSCSPT